MRKLISFIKGEVVLCASLALALASMLIVPPSAAYADYVDWNVLMLLFCLMGVVAGFRSIGAFDAAAAALTRRAGSARALVPPLVAACFFCAMLVTNDVALLAFVPLTVTLLAGTAPRSAIYAVALEAVAANLGSMATPIGNPQNLCLYSRYAMSLGEFFQATLPIAALSLALVALACAFAPNAPLGGHSPTFAGGGAQAQRIPHALAVRYGLLFALCVAAVLKALPVWACFAVVVACMLLFDRTLLKQIDYSLLATFVCFFVFVGNSGSLAGVRAALGEAIGGRELEIGILSSQVISNVPAALLLSPFTENARALMRGVNIGGLGTPVASLASLIALRLYMKAPGAKAGRYLKVFTLMNLAFLAILYGAARLLAFIGI